MAFRLLFRAASGVLISALVCGPLVAQTEAKAERSRVERFTGFVATEKVALDVGEALLRGLRGDEYVEMYKPLRARKIQGFWVVDGLAERPRKELRTFETAMIAIDPGSCNVAVYGLMHEARMIELLKLRKPIRFPGPKPIGRGKKAAPVKAIQKPLRKG